MAESLHSKIRSCLRTRDSKKEQSSKPVLPTGDGKETAGHQLRHPTRTQDTNSVTLPEPWVDAADRPPGNGCTSVPGEDGGGSCAGSFRTSHQYHHGSTRIPRSKPAAKPPQQAGLKLPCYNRDSQLKMYLIQVHLAAWFNTWPGAQVSLSGRKSTAVLTDLQPAEQANRLAFVWGLQPERLWEHTGVSAPGSLEGTWLRQRE